MKNPKDHYSTFSPFKEEWLNPNDKKKHEKYNYKVGKKYDVDWEKLYKIWKKKKLSFRRLAELTGTSISSQWVNFRLREMEDIKKSMQI